MKMSRYLFVVFLVLLTACSALPNHKDDLGKKNDDFILRVRWLDFPGASLHFDEARRAEFLDRFDDVEDLKVTDFITTRLDIDVPEEKVTIHYRIEYYQLPSATVEKKRFSLTWEQQPAGSDGKVFWRITEPFPELP